MERVTFEDAGLIKRVKETCVSTWRNAVPGFSTAGFDDPAFRGCGAMAREQLAKNCPGAASTNVATVFSLPDGKVLHVAPGAFEAKALLRELEFALAVAAAVRDAGDDAGARARACAAKHTERKEKLAADKDVAVALRPVLTRVHELLAKAPLMEGSALKVEDYGEGRLDVEATRKAGEEVKRQLERALQR